jgi:hypothetical protein
LILESWWAWMSNSSTSRHLEKLEEEYKNQNKGVAGLESDIYFAQIASENRSRIELLEKNQSPINKFYKSMSILNVTNIITAIILPIILVVISIFCFNSVIKQYISPNIIILILSFLGVWNIINIFYIPKQLKEIERRLDQLEKHLYK